MIIRKKVQPKRNCVKLGKAAFAVGFVAGGLYLAKEWVMNEFFNLAFTVKPTKVGRLLGSPTEGTPDRDREWLRCQKTEKVTIQSADGYTLVGYLLARVGAKRTILMMHGWRGSWYGDFGSMARYLHVMGCNMLLIEQRAMGESGGEVITYGIRESDDCVRWAWYLAKKDPSMPIYLHGVSLGASTVATALNKDLPTQVKGAIVDCGFTSCYDIMRKCVMGIHPALWAISGPIERKFFFRSGVTWNKETAKGSLKEAKVPVLFIHGAEDDFVPLWMGEENYKACASRKRLIIIKDARHVQSFVKQPKVYLDEMWDFFGWEPADIPILY